jgi:Mycobacterium membrane protein
LPLPKITVRSSLLDTPARPRFAPSHVDNIGTISNTLHDLDGDVYDYPDETYDTDGADYGGYGELAWPADRRGRAVALVVAGVVALGAIATAVIINSGDSATTKATLGAPVPTISSAPRSTVAPSSSPSPSRAPLPSETVTTVPSTARPTPSLRTAPTLTPMPTAAPPPINAVPPPALNPRTVIYSVTGTKQLLDLVNIVYTDARGYPQTEFNVSLPWTKMVVLNPGVETESVVATSFSGRLSCAVVNAQGQAIVASSNNAIIATCTR